METIDNIQISLSCGYINALRHLKSAGIHGVTLPGRGRKLFFPNGTGETLRIRRAFAPKGRSSRLIRCDTIALSIAYHKGLNVLSLASYDPIYKTMEALSLPHASGESLTVPQVLLVRHAVGLDHIAVENFIVPLDILRGRG